MQWDVFCRVIDNFGDIGVCWRLCADLAGRGEGVRLWVDDASALAWMAPPAQGPYQIEVRTWAEAEALADLDPHGGLLPGDVVIEAFGCNPPDAFVARMQRARPPVWLNLEYLSAEAWVDRHHALPSPVMSGPGKGLTKWFYFPGFTPATGGLLREPGLLARRRAFQDSPQARDAWLAGLGLSAVEPGERLWSVFCYPHAPLADLLDALQSQGPDAPPTRLLLTPGPASDLGRAWLAAQGPATARGTHPVQLHFLPLLSQTDFDHLLWACDLNFVRGEDSAVRALWAGRPHVWHIYAQDDGVHEGKLDAFMDRWMACWPSDVSGEVRALWRWWNALPDASPMSPPPSDRSSAWALHSENSSKSLSQAEDLLSALFRFVASKR